MELLIDRKYKKEKYTIGNMYVDGKYFSNTLEDTDRGLKQTMSDEEIRKIKIYGETAIPTGRYKITRTQSAKFGKKMILINNVPGFTGIRIHAGNFTKDTYGCPLVGENKIKGQLVNPRYYSNLLDNIVAKALESNEEVWITIQ